MSQANGRPGDALRAFTPKLVTVLGEGYTLSGLRADLVAGLTVAIVALPLSMAIAIASGATPARGLYAAIIGGFFVSLLGGSRFQIGGPAGAFIGLVAAAIDRVGLEGMATAVIVSGVMLAAAGALRLGTYVKFIPFPVTVGFTAGIAVIIAASQLHDLFGLTLATKEPGALLPKLAALSDAADTLNPAALAIATGSMALILGIRRWRPGLPVLLIAVVATSVIAALAHLPVATVGSRFGAMPQGLLAPRLPDWPARRLDEIIPIAISFALLGSIESLLSAVVADGMTGRRHRSNVELIAQGVGNIASGLCGGLPVTGAIARTATNVRAGARGPLAGIFMALFLLLFLLIAAPLAGYIPLASLAGLLLVVAWDMIEKHAVWVLLRSSWSDATVLLSTFLLTAFRDLTEGIVVGFAIGTLSFLSRLARQIDIRALLPLDEASDRAGPGEGQETPRPPGLDPRIAIYRISGAFFFAAAASIGTALDDIGAQPAIVIIDLAAVPYLDSTAANVLQSFAARCRRRGATLYLTGTSHVVRESLFASGMRRPLVSYKRDVARALGDAHRQLAASDARRAAG